MIVASLLWLALAQPPSPAEVFQTAERFYGEGRFEEAAAAYETLLSRGIEEGALYYNLGNAYFRQGKMGRAILSYERALRLLPGDPDVRANLELANARAGNAVAPPDVPGSLLWIVQAYRALDPDTCARILSLSFVAGGTGSLFLILLPGAAPRARAAGRGVLAAAVLPALVATAFLAAKLYASHTKLEAIVLAPVAPVRSGPGASHPELTEVREGLKVEVVGAREGWLQIALPEGVTGWVPRSDAETL